MSDKTERTKEEILEAAHKWALDNAFAFVTNANSRYHSFIAGAKWMEEYRQSSPVESNRNYEHIIDFATWYSGMEREKVERAHDRYLREVHGHRGESELTGMNRYSNVSGDMVQNKDGGWVQFHAIVGTDFEIKDWMRRFAKHADYPKCQIRKSGHCTCGLNKFLEEPKEK